MPRTADVGVLSVDCVQVLFFVWIYSFIFTRRALKAPDKSALAATKDKQVIPFCFFFFVKLLYRRTYVIRCGKRNDRKIFRNETREIVSKQENNSQNSKMMVNKKKKKYY